MELSNKEWTLEQERLDKIKSIIENQLRDSENSRKNAFGQGMDIGRDFWDNDVTVPESAYDIKAIVDITQNLQSVKREQQKVEIISNNIKKLKHLKESLYFGRIDFKENDCSGYSR